MFYNYEKKDSILLSRHGNKANVFTHFVSYLTIEFLSMTLSDNTTFALHF